MCKSPQHHHKAAQKAERETWKQVPRSYPASTSSRAAQAALPGLSQSNPGVSDIKSKRCEKVPSTYSLGNPRAVMLIRTTACVAQWIRRTPPKGEIVGSSPTVGYFLFFIFYFYLKQKTFLPLF
jgi:hypothetical protein